MEKHVLTENVRIDVPGGTVMDAYLARPSGGGPHPGILVLQEIFGVNAHIRDIAERLAREGYAAFAPDLFHRIVPGYLGKYEDVGASIAISRQYTAQQSETDIKAACDRLRGIAGIDGSRIGALGFCMGGRLAFTANAVAQLRAAVSFYGNIAPDKLYLAEKLSGPMLLVWAGKDAYITLEQHRSVVDTLRQLDKPFLDVEFSHSNHGFFCDAREDYDPIASAQAWPLTLAFLRSRLGG
jgi:carboxymethylenebutenolidase